VIGAGGATTHRRISSDSEALESGNANVALRAGMSNPRLVYTPRQDATPDGELNALAGVYRFILFETSARKEATLTRGPDDAERSPDEIRAKNIIPK
jgi:hypothetical protein